MRGLVTFLLLFVFVSFVIFSFSFVVVNLNNLNNKKVEVKEAKSFEFSTFTSAVCENKEELVHCKDEVFVNCNGKVSKAIELAECNGFKLEVPKATGAAVFGKGWRDPRN